MSETWTEYRVEALTKFWADGFSYTAISAKLGLTRNQVCGKLFRMGLPEPDTKIVNPNNIARAAIRSRRESEKTLYKLFAPRPADDLAAQSLNLSFDAIDRATQCVFPFGDGPFSFCGHPKAQGSSYCEGHHLICWKAPKRTYQNRAPMRTWI